MQRIVVIGTSGSGKTTLAREIARRLDVPALELDAIHWQPNWTSTPDCVMREIIERHVAQATWTVDGNYARLRDLIMARADTIIWLDYSLTVIFGRVLRRTIRRCWTGEELWSGNRESLWMQVASRESILLWVLTTWRKRRRDYPKLLKTWRAAGKCVYRFRTPEETQHWLDNMGDDHRASQ